MSDNHAWSGTVDAFLGCSNETLLSQFQGHHQKTSLEVPNQSHIQAWTDSWKILRTTFQMLINTHPEAIHWFIVFEYGGL